MGIFNGSTPKRTATDEADGQVRAAKPEQGELLHNGNGLYLRVRPNSKTWIMRRSRFGRMTVSTLGKYPALVVGAVRPKIWAS